MAAEACDLLDTALVWDNHACMPLRPTDHSFLPQLERVKSSGVDVVTLNIGFGPHSRAEHLAMLESFHRWIEAHAADYCVAHSVADIDAARAAGKLAILFDIEGMALFDDGNLDMIETLREGGVGWMLVAYNRSNAAGGGCMDDDPGLSKHGKRLLEEMSRVGMIACCSHTGHRTARELMDMSHSPVIFSHSNASAVHAHPRNIPDDLIRACADTGGVVGINGLGDFLGEGVDFPSLIMRHIDHMVQLVGPEHVGLSLDYCFDQQELLDYLSKLPEFLGHVVDARSAVRLAPPEVFPELVKRMQAHGYPDSAILGILGGNWLRVAGQVWKVPANS